MLFLCPLYKRIVKGKKIAGIVAITFLFFIQSASVFLPETRADQISSLILQASQKYGISPDLIYKVIEAESSFDSFAVSSCNAKGLMQITRPTWDWICKDYLQVEWDFNECSFDPKKNIEVGTRFLMWINDFLDTYKDKLNASKENLLLACYNAGPGAVKNHDFRVPPFKETQNYVKKINALTR